MSFLKVRAGRGEVTDEESMLFFRHFGQKKWPLRAANPGDLRSRAGRGSENTPLSLWGSARQQAAERAGGRHTECACYFQTCVSQSGLPRRLGL
jgi:hypothetical protein